MAPAGPATVVIETLGCKLNQADSEALAQRVLAAGYHIGQDVAEADAYILNTCTVTHVADRKARGHLRRARRLKPNCLLVATGCYAERAGSELERQGLADLVVGRRDRDHLVDLIAAGRAAQQTEPLVGVHALTLALSQGERAGGTPPFTLHPSPPSSPPPSTLHPPPSPRRTRSFIKIQEGCRHGCAFCIVPRVRGAPRDVPLEEVVASVRARASAGVQEVVLTGTELGDYGLGGGPTLPRLLKTLLAETAIPRLRVSSLQPQELSDELLGLWSREPRLCRHLHLALQSGSPSVLQRMRRPYPLGDYEDALRAAREALPGLAVTTDVIVGFPGETGAEFAETLDFCQRLAFADIHTFPYSPRSGTAAARLPDTVPAPLKTQRVGELQAVVVTLATRFRRSFLGQSLSVLWEGPANVSRGGQPLLSGLSDNYLRVFTPWRSELQNRISTVSPDREDAGALWVDGPESIAA